MRQSRKGAIAWIMVLILITVFTWVPSARARVVATIDAAAGKTTPTPIVAESDYSTLHRLRFEMDMASLDVDDMHRKLRPYAYSDSPPKALLDSLRDARTRLDIATRNFNRAMR